MSDQLRRELLATVGELLRRVVVALQHDDLDAARLLWSAVRPHMDAALAVNDEVNEVGS